MYRKTNVEFIADMMNFSDYGGLVQIFIIEAINQYAHLIVTEQLKNPAPGLISDEAWLGVAREVKGRLENRGKEDKTVKIRGE